MSGHFQVCSVAVAAVRLSNQQSQADRAPEWPQTTLIAGVTRRPQYRCPLHVLPTDRPHAAILSACIFQCSQFVDTSVTVSGYSPHVRRAEPVSTAHYVQIIYMANKTFLPLSVSHFRHHGHWTEQQSGHCPQTVCAVRRFHYVHRLVKCNTPAVDIYFSLQN